MESQLQALAKNVQDTIQNINDTDTLIEYKNTILGKKGELTTILK